MLGDEGSYMPVSDDFLTAGLKITGHFEDSDDQVAAVSGNFDGMGIWLGVWQWNIGSNSRQPIVKTLGKAAVTSTMPRFGEDLWRACNTTVAEGLAIVRAWQPNNKLPRAVFNELKSCVRSQPFQGQQLKAARKVGNTAWATAVDWAQKQGRETATKREVSWFYEVFNQNGGLKSVTPKKVQDYIDNHSAHATHAFISNFLSARTATHKLANASPT